MSHNPLYAEHLDREGGSNITHPATAHTLPSTYLSQPPSCPPHAATISSDMPMLPMMSRHTRSPSRPSVVHPSQITTSMTNTREDPNPNTHRGRWLYRHLLACCCDSTNGAPTTVSTRCNGCYESHCTESMDAKVRHKTAWTF